MKQFKFRAEGFGDLLAFLNEMAKHNLERHEENRQDQGLWFDKIEIENVPEPTVTLTTAATEFSFYDEHAETRIRQIMGGVVDGHVMLETLQPLESYTGERDFTKS